MTPDIKAQIHSLKTWPEHYEAIVAGTKRFEVRKNDRGFKVGDVLALMEWEPDGQAYTRRGVSVRVTYLLHGPDFGLPADMCVMSIDPLAAPECLSVGNELYAVSFENFP